MRLVVDVVRMRDEMCNSGIYYGVWRNTGSDGRLQSLRMRRARARRYEGEIDEIAYAWRVLTRF